MSVPVLSQICPVGHIRDTQPISRVADMSVPDSSCSFLSLPALAIVGLALTLLDLGSQHVEDARRHGVVIQPAVIGPPPTTHQNGASLGKLRGLHANAYSNKLIVVGQGTAWHLLPRCGPQHQQPRAQVSRRERPGIGLLDALQVQLKAPAFGAGLSRVRRRWQCRCSSVNGHVRSRPPNASRFASRIARIKASAF